MGFGKEILAENEAKQARKLEGYRKKLFKDGTYSMPCPHCLGALSNYDVHKEQCIHCGYKFKWKIL